MTDLVIPTASPNPASVDWVPLGNTGSVPTTQPSVRVYRSTAQSIASGTATSLIFDTARYDVGPSPHWSAGTNPDRLTCQVAGIYVISAALRFGAASGGANRFVWIDLNGGSSNGGITTGGQTGIAWANTGGPQLSASTVVKLNVGDYVRCVVYQDSGAALNLLNSTGTDMTQSDFSMALLGGMQGPAGTAASYGTQLPASPVDGQEHVLVDSVTNPSYQWRFRYNAQSTSAYKWEFVGGAPKEVIINADEILAATGSWIDAPSQIGPSFIVPRAGDYTTQGWANFYAASGVAAGYMGPAIAAGSPTLPIAWGTGGGNLQGGAVCNGTMTVAAGQEIRQRYYVTGPASTHVVSRLMWVTPKRVS